MASTDKIVHFVGFTDDRYWNAVKVWGFPHYIHAGWDLRAKREIAPGDLLVFANGEWTQQPRAKTYHDLTEPTKGTQNGQGSRKS